MANKVTRRAAGVLLALSVSALIGALLQAPSTQAQGGQDLVPVTVTILRVVSFEDPDPGLVQGVADMFPRVKIADFPNEEREAIVNQSDISPNWTFTQIVDRSITGDFIDIQIEIYDEDFLSDERLDIDPVNGATTLQLTLNLGTGSWFGDVEPNVSVSRGDGDVGEPCCLGVRGGGHETSVVFDITTLEGGGDADGDGLRDSWERFGYDANFDGIVDVDLPGFGADPLHKDLFVELDWMTGEEPVQAELNLVKEAFALAPIDAGGTVNPDGLPGINLWIDTGGLLAPDGTLVGDDLGGGNEVPSSVVILLSPDFYAIKRDNFGPRASVFRYGLNAFFCDTCPGGSAELGGNDFILYNSFGGALMHELGHNLGLQHGGNNTGNCKPNYVSVMNYDHAYGIRQNAGGISLDYSPPRHSAGRGVALAPLVEDALVEAPLDPNDSDNRFVFTNALGQKAITTLTLAPNWDGALGDSGIAVNIDSTGVDGTPVGCLNFTSNSVLTGHDDWSAISLDPRPSVDSVDAAINEVEGPEMTFEEYLDLEDELNTTDLVVQISAVPDPAIAGAGLDYRVEVVNNGANRATGVVATLMLPAGVTHTGDDGGCVVAGQELTCEIGELVSRGAADISVTTAIAPDLVSLAGGPTVIAAEVVVTSSAIEANDADNMASVETTVVGRTDIGIDSFSLSNPVTQALIGEVLHIDLAKEVSNAGPSGPVDASLQLDATTTTGASVTSAITTPIQALELGESRAVTETISLKCTAPTTATISVANEISLAVPLDDLLSDGAVVYVRSAVDGRYLDGDPSNVDLSTSPRADDEWTIGIVDPNTITLYNAFRGGYLDADGASKRYNVDLSTTVGDDDQWVVVPLDNGNVLLRSVARNRYLDADRSNVDTSATARADDEWYLQLVSPPAPVGPSADPNPANNSAALDFEVDCVTPVKIWALPSRIDLARSTVRITVLKTWAGRFGLPVDFDPRQINTESVRFGTRDGVWNETAGAFALSEKDNRSGYGYGGLTLRFLAGDTDLSAGDTEACVKGTYTDETGTHTFFGCVHVTVR